MTKHIFQLATFLEIVAVFFVFALFGGYAIPDSNEPYYVIKAINFWQPNWIADDSFLQSADSHRVFYATFGWLSFFLSPYEMAVAGRCTAWLLLAWTWRRLSFSLIPLRWTAVFSAAAFAYYVDSFNMAGEWIIGGIEGKSLAFPFVFLGLEAMFRQKWKRAWLFLGIAAAFHVLVGGWTAAIVLFARSLSLVSKTPSRKNALLEFLALCLGGLISLLGLVPVLLLDRGTTPEIVSQAHQIYVFERLYHHLDPYQLPWTFIARFYLLAGIWCLFSRNTQLNHYVLKSRWNQFEFFIWGTLFLSFIGLAVSFGLRNNQALAADILRFYWFRLSDIAVPMGIALGGLLQFLTILNRIRLKISADCFVFSSLRFYAVFVAIPFLIYLLTDYLLYGSLWLPSVNVPDQSIPWGIAILLSGIVLGKVGDSKRFNVQTRLLFYMVFYAVLLLYAPFISFKDIADSRTRTSYARTESGNPYYAENWRDVCYWIRKNTASTARFYVPRESTTFKWFARRSDVGVWKDIPQDAAGIVAWQDKMHDLFFYRDENSKLCSDRSLTILLWWKTPEELKKLHKQYGFDYIVCAKDPALLKHTHLKSVYENALFTVLKVEP